MRLKLKEIAALVEGELLGDPEAVITGISGIKEAREGDITFLANSKYSGLMNTTKASAIITGRDISGFAKPLIRTDNPSGPFTKVVSLVAPNDVKHPEGIHPTALISPGAVLGKNVSVGAYTVIEEGAKVGDHTVIYSGCYLGRHSAIGRDCLIYACVSVRERIDIRDRVIIHSGAVIGSDGFGFAMVRGGQKKITQ